MITTLYSDFGYKPIIIYDVCREPIRDVEYALAVNLPGSEQGSLLDVKHVHKGACDEQCDQDLGGMTNSTEMLAYLIDLMHNTGLDAEKITGWLGGEAQWGRLGRS